MLKKIVTVNIVRCVLCGVRTGAVCISEVYKRGFSRRAGNEGLTVNSCPTRTPIYFTSSPGRPRLAERASQFTKKHSQGSGLVGTLELCCLTFLATLSSL